MSEMSVAGAQAAKPKKGKVLLDALLGRFASAARQGDRDPETIRHDRADLYGGRLPDHADHHAIGRKGPKRDQRPL